MKRAWLIATGGVLTAAAVGALVIFLHDPNAERVLLSAKDPSWIEVTVTGRDPGFKHVTTLRIRGNGIDATTRIDDDMWFGNASIILDEPWILVANDGHIVAGFDKHNQKFLGEYDWPQLPYLLANGKGRVLATTKLGAHAYLPVNYPPPATTPRP